LIGSVTARSQDLTFSQFFEQPLLLNPALAGVFDGDIRVSGIFRNQWQSVTVPFKTTALSVEYKMPFDKYNDWITIGSQMTEDVAGDINLKRVQFLPFFNFHKSLNNEYDQYLSVAFMGGPVYSQFDPTKLQLDDQFVNGSYNSTNPTQQVFSQTGFTYWDASTGVTFSSSFGEGNHFYLGTALFHFNQPKVGFYKSINSSILPQKFVFNTGWDIKTSDINTLKIYGDYFRQAGNEQSMLGLSYATELIRDYNSDQTVNLTFGTYYRWNDAIIPVIHLDMYEFSAGLSYDINVSKLSVASQLKGGFELSLVYRSKLKNHSAGSDLARCPRF